MPSTVVMKRRTGPAGSPTDTVLDESSQFVNFSASDDPNPGLLHPVPIPSSGHRHSFAVAIAAFVTASPDTSVTSFKLHPPDGGLGWGTGSVIRVGRQTQQTYTQATGTVDVDGTDMQTLYPGISNADDFYSTYGSSSKLAMDDKTGYDHVSIGQATGWQIFQWELSSTGTSGNKTPVAFYLSWVEV